MPVDTKELRRLARQDAGATRETAVTLNQAANELDAARETIEQLRVQLAGCSAAALGGTGEDVIAKRGMYGWSASYQDVLDIRIKYDAARARIAELETPNLFWDAADPERPIDDIANYCYYCCEGSESEQFVSIKILCARSFENKFAHYRWNPKEEQMKFLGLFDVATEVAKEEGNES